MWLKVFWVTLLWAEAWAGCSPGSPSNLTYYCQLFWEWQIPLNLTIKIKNYHSSVQEASYKIFIPIWKWARGCIWKLHESVQAFDSFPSKYINASEYINILIKMLLILISYNWNWLQVLNTLIWHCVFAVEHARVWNPQTKRKTSLTARECASLTSLVIFLSPHS